MTTYWRTSTGTLHVRPDCHSAARSTVLEPVEVPLEPFGLWERCWTNRDHHIAGEPGMPVSVDGVEVDGYGVRLWACLHCVEQAAIDQGWVNTHPPDPERRHR